MGFWKNLGLLTALASASAVSRREESSTVSYPDYDLLADCPGYRVTRVQESHSGVKADLKLAGKACNAYGDDIEELNLEVTYETDERIHVKIQDKANSVYQVPESVFARPESQYANPEKSAFKFSYTEEPFSFKVSRRDNNDVIFDSSASSLIFESQYIRLRTSLPNDPALYGLGSHTDPFRLNTTDYIRTLWNQDSYGVPEGANLYGSHPIYLEHRDSGSHGVFLLNSNGMDIIISKDEGGQFLEYNALGGVFDFYFLAGPSPVDVSKQYAQVVGRPALQPYWGLGFHQCRYGYRDAFQVAEVVYNYSQAGIPLETMWTDIDYMDSRLIFTTDPGRYPLEKVRALVDTLHKNDQHYILMVDPAAGYQDNYPTLDRAIEDNVLLLRQNGSVFLGVVWPGVTVFPDWFAENATNYWNNEFALFFDPETGVDIDGLWIDMNEPSSFACLFPCARALTNFQDNPYEQAKGYPPTRLPVRENPRSLPGWPCEFQPPGDGGCESSDAKRDLFRPGGPVRRDVSHDSLFLPERSRPKEGTQQGLDGRDYLYPKYSIHNAAANAPDWNADKGGLSNKTVLTDVVSQNGLVQYDTHQLYGHMMGIASYDAMLSRRPEKRPFIITRSTFPGSGRKVGHWLGDNMSTWWHYRASIRTALAFTSIYQFPMVGSDVCGFGGNTTEELCSRWAALGAFNTFYRNHNGDTSPDQEFYLWEKVADSARKAIGIRYRLLDYIYTAIAKASEDGTPVMTPMFFNYPEDKNTLDLELQYFYGPGVLVAPVTEEGATSVDVYLPKDKFYDWYTHETIQGNGAMHTFGDVDITHIPLLIKSGVILPLRESSANTTTDLRKENFEILVALDDKGEASGELYLDDGDSVDLKINGVSNLKFSYKNGELKVTGSFGHKLAAVISKITVLGKRGHSRHGSDGSGFKNPRHEDDKNSYTKDVDVSLNGPSTIPA
ncbi:alpha-glucosidase [Geosmithia morbida]|uniref:Probable alpha/beta-glucosidase agdC n=1 Tax=Geosmithia morbida TaxID=1094350 RepID=A0A9P4Z0P5_9HYPO|nr:alpha-glucosidase [Geosmithia morbida]KAF4125997.1 alpha-glucosidase [Geosmithia morbida]